MSKVCKNCGSMMNDNDAFCQKCGARDVVVQQQWQSRTRPTLKPRMNIGTATSSIVICKIGILIASILMMLGTILPYRTIDGKKLGFLGFDGKIKANTITLINQKAGSIIIVLGILSILLVFLGKKTLVAIAGVLSGGFAILLAIVRTNPEMIFERLENEVYSKYATQLSKLIHMEEGFYLLTFAAVALMIFSLVYSALLKKEQGNM